LYTFIQNEIPILPPSITLLYFFLNIELTSSTTVDFPFEPVTAMMGLLVAQDPNSISLTIGIF